jgi:metal-responsive CopG/Arc/MetJ family transcriptional regulator
MLRATVTLPDDLFKEAKSFSGNNFSALVSEALRKYLQEAKANKALNSFGCWKSREENSVDMVNEMRKDEGRDFADSDH